MSIEEVYKQDCIQLSDQIDELKERVRELNEERAHLAHMEVKCAELLERIAKAREILAHVNSEEYALCTCMLAIDNALEALEGE